MFSAYICQLGVRRVSSRLKKMTFVSGKPEMNFKCSFLDVGDCHTNDYGVLNKVLKTRPQLFEFILDTLSNPSFSSVMTWEGTNGQFVIIRPDQVARLWGERNGRTNMTYQKFCRALRYYYRKGVLIKIRGRKFTYKFNLPELDRQYGYKRISFPATREPSGTPSFMIPATSVCATDVFPVSPSLMVTMPHENNLSPRSFSYSHYFPFFFEF